MKALLDTNVLVSLCGDSGGRTQDLSMRAITRLRAKGLSPVIVPQVVYEFWVAATRPVTSNGLGLSPSEAEAEVRAFCKYFSLLLDERAIYERWLSLVVDHKVVGKVGHDARLVAAMLRHDIDHILTFNPSDFKRFDHIVAQTPEVVLADSSS